MMSEAVRQRRDKKKRAARCEANPLVASFHRGEQRQCETCGEIFMPTWWSQCYCSTQCKGRAKRERRRVRRAGGDPGLSFAEQNVNILSFVECERCGEMFRQKDSSQKYCSVSCASSLWISCAWCGAESIAKFRFENDYCSEECYLAHQASRTIHCVICNKLFFAKTNVHQCCSDDCRMEKARRHAQTVAQLEHGKRTKERKCKNCGVLFSPVYGSKYRVFCSKLCAKRYGNKRNKEYGSNHQSRAKRYGVKYRWFSERAILRRDGWVCYICGIDTPPRLRGTCEDNAPELDHVVPLSRGGKHVKDNVRCCCRHCNGLKKAMTMEELEESHSVTLKARRAYAKERKDYRNGENYKVRASFQSMRGPVMQLSLFD